MELQIERDNEDLKEALRLIKRNMSTHKFAQMSNSDMHEAIQLIVSVARRNGLLLEQ